MVVFRALEAIARTAASRFLVSDRLVNGMDWTIHVLAPNRLNDFVGWGPQQFGYDGELVDMIFARKQRFALQHLGKYASGAPDVHLDIILLPCEHDLRRTIVSRRNISRHLRVLDSSQTKVANFQIAIFIHQNIAWLQVPVDHSGRMNIFEAALLSSAPIFARRVRGPWSHTKIW